MLNLNFKINDHYLALYCIRNTANDCFVEDQPREDIIAFQNLAWNTSKSSSDFLRSGPNSKAAIIGNKLEPSSEAALLFLDTIITTSEFRKVREQTEKSLARVQEEWSTNVEKTQLWMEELTGFDFNKQIDSYLTHPSLKNGSNIEGVIYWSERNDWPNYNTVYLWHEVLHNYFEKSEVSHAIIELITDNELRYRLNRVTYPPFVGHKELTAIKEKLLPQWKNYLKKSKKDILQFLEDAKY